MVEMLTVKELKNILKKCNDEDIVKIEIRKFSTIKEENLDITYEDIYKVDYEIYIDNSSNDGLILCTTLYEE